MPGYTPLLDEAASYVKLLFESKINDMFAFHNLDHTRSVVSACREMSAYYTLEEEDNAALELAALFHDTGYSTAGIARHEEESIRIAQEWLGRKNQSSDLAARVASIIAATRMPQSPGNLVEEIICDADLYHLGTEAFAEKTKALRKEYIQVLGKKISRKKWRQNNIEFLRGHHYFTDYCREKLEPAKQKTLAKLIQKAADSGSGPEGNRVMARNKSQVPVGKKPEEPASMRNERSVTTMFRIMSSNHNDLSSMADSKANIMISVNSIIISIMVSVLLGRLAYYRNLVIPTLILILICMGAIIFAILATRPKISMGTFTEDDIRNKRINLLFFGNFYNMKLEEYNWAMNEMMNDKNYLYDSMIKDIYFLGVILARKYRYLRISYNIFMYGLIVAMLAFAIAMFFPSNVGSIP